MVKIRPYFVTFLVCSDAIFFKKRLIWSNFISFSVQHTKLRLIHAKIGGNPVNKKLILSRSISLQISINNCNLE